MEIFTKILNGFQPSEAINNLRKKFDHRCLRESSRGVWLRLLVINKPLTFFTKGSIIYVWEVRKLPLVISLQCLDCCVSVRIVSKLIFLLRKLIVSMYLMSTTIFENVHVFLQLCYSMHYCYLVNGLVNEEVS